MCGRTRPIGHDGGNGSTGLSCGWQSLRCKPALHASPARIVCDKASQEISALPPMLSKELTGNSSSTYTSFRKWSKIVGVTGVLLQALRNPTKRNRAYHGQPIFKVYLLQLGQKVHLRLRFWITCNSGSLATIGSLAIRILDHLSLATTFAQ